MTEQSGEQQRGDNSTLKEIGSDVSKKTEGMTLGELLRVLFEGGQDNMEGNKGKAPLVLEELRKVQRLRDRRDWSQIEGEMQKRVAEITDLIGQERKLLKPTTDE